MASPNRCAISPIANDAALDFMSTLSRRLGIMSITTDEARVASRPLHVAQVIRDGGGTASVELTVAGKLRDRGHRVTLLGPPEVREQAHDRGFHLEQLAWPPQVATRSTEDLVPRMIDASDAWARQLAPRFDDGVDLVVADCAVFGALMAARTSDVPSAALMPTVYVAGALRARADHVRGDWASALDGLNHAREALELPPVASLTEQILDVDRLLVLSSRSFELPDVRPPDHVRYVGPQLPKRRRPPAVRLPDGDEPLVLVSLSTTDQGQLDVLKRLLAGIALLPVRALVTLGNSVDADQLDPPANAVLERFVPHESVLPHASLVVTHAGHGTVMAAVSAGVPLVCVPMGRDQPAVAARVTRHGLGVRIGPDADVETVRSAIDHVLNEPGYREAARRMATAIEPANLIVDEVEALATARLRRVS
ncbi:glycosyltransferase [Micromonospora sp. URMC 103]|uniref:glycosyltransferase n=1 Tax=Micromonospora sp. URMC 103 TaxID=3423406 RepID=UPI003F1B9E58